MKSHSRSAYLSPNISSASPEVAGVVEVALLQRLPRTAHVFDYLPGSDALAVGDLVEVPFRRSRAKGVVVRHKQHTRITLRLRTVGPVLARGFITTNQLSLARWLADHYGVSLGAALELCVPALPNRRFIPSPVTSFLVPPTRRRPSVSTILFTTQAQRDEVVTALVRRALGRKSQVLLLVPEIHYLEHWRTRLTEWRVANYSAELSLEDRRRVREEIVLGDVDVVIGTRAALFLPWRRLGGVLIDHAESESYKQADQNPRYQATEVARRLALLHGAPCALLSPAMPLELWYEHRQGDVTWRELSGRGALFGIIDMTREQLPQGRSLLSATLQQEVDETLARRGKVFLYLNRRGGATATLCRDCGTSPSCQSCRRPLVQTSDQTELTCYHCGTRQPIALPCPRCGGVNVRLQGAGLASLEIEVREIWPKVTLQVIEGDTSRASASQVESARIVVGSRAAFSLIDWSKRNLVGLVAPDSELALPEFRAAEELWATARVFLASSAGRVLAQTRRPGHYVWQSLMAKSSDAFYQAELKERAPYRYPPLGGLVRFTTQSVHEAEALTLAREARGILAPLLTPGAELIGPYPDYYHKLRGRYRFHLLLRYAKRSFDPARLWRELPDAILVDRHPWSILS